MVIVLTRRCEFFFGLKSWIEGGRCSLFKHKEKDAQAYFIEASRRYDEWMTNRDPSINYSYFYDVLCEWFDTNRQLAIARRDFCDASTSSSVNGSEEQTDEDDDDKQKQKVQRHQLSSSSNHLPTIPEESSSEGKTSSSTSTSTTSHHQKGVGTSHGELAASTTRDIRKEDGSKSVDAHDSNGQSAPYFQVAVPPDETTVVSDLTFSPSSVQRPSNGHRTASLIRCLDNVSSDDREGQPKTSVGTGEGSGLPKETCDDKQSKEGHGDMLHQRRDVLESKTASLSTSTVSSRRQSISSAETEPTTGRQSSKVSTDVNQGSIRVDKEVNEVAEEEEKSSDHSIPRRGQDDDDDDDDGNLRSTDPSVSTADRKSISGDSCRSTIIADLEELLPNLEAGMQKVYEALFDSNRDREFRDQAVGFALMKILESTTYGYEMIQEMPEKEKLMHGIVNFYTTTEVKAFISTLCEKRNFGKKTDRFSYPKILADLIHFDDARTFLSHVVAMSLLLGVIFVLEDIIKFPFLSSIEEAKKRN
mmetsp:Transcript_16105/g.39671  ORF Transcript_16105/g.39671 Transcript_16105/m.39671 type:complete len:531 (+) Transcript_16105:952-2544(+)